MKQLLLSVLCIVSIAGCKSSTGPDPSANPAVIPQDGSTFTFRYAGTDPAVQLTEHVTLMDTIASRFYAHRLSDTIGTFSTTAIDSFQVLANGDLRICGCDNLALPIGTHMPYEMTTTTPVKKDGVIGDGIITIRNMYLDDEVMLAAGQYFVCTKLARETTVYTRFGQPSLDSTFVITDTYWYSAKLGYFVKEQEERSTNGSPAMPAWTRTLLAYKLGK
ncbi:MAG: hypothetical protein Q8922_03575 [Bacteroidota bacterium]|nr:hypothetical protein [Bacteroidota bacterium]MDP4233372.1 hypothetical protein [Bacteroidota bacterium]MDP4242238.1 hypothetical protein [Bacteroidota bacterium]MDP4286994.1 hypothetical protein [Bacteroidota bacterium]